MLALHSSDWPCHLNFYVLPSTLIRLPRWRNLCVSNSWILNAFWKHICKNIFKNGSQSSDVSPFGPGSNVYSCIIPLRFAAVTQYMQQERFSIRRICVITVTFEQRCIDVSVHVLNGGATFGAKRPAHHKASDGHPMASVPMPLHHPSPACCHC